MGRLDQCDHVASGGGADRQRSLAPQRPLELHIERAPVAGLELQGVPRAGSIDVQGLNLAFRVGFMVGNWHWTLYGALFALVGIAQVVWSNTRQTPR